MIGLFANEKHAITNEIDVKKIEQIIDKIKYINDNLCHYVIKLYYEYSDIISENNVKDINEELKHKYKNNIIDIKNDIQKAQITGISNEMGSHRIWIWRITLKLISKKPILGCGPDNLWQGLIQNCPQETYNYAKKTYTAIDKAHNEYLQIGATLGIPALICYLTFIALIIVPKIKLTINNKIYFIICLVIMSYLVQAFFNISTIGVAPLFWMLLGLSENKDIINKLNK